MRSLRASQVEQNATQQDFWEKMTKNEKSADFPELQLPRVSGLRPNQGGFPQFFWILSDLRPAAVCLLVLFRIRHFTSFHQFAVPQVEILGGKSKNCSTIGFYCSTIGLKWLNKKEKRGKKMRFNPRIGERGRGRKRLTKLGPEQRWGRKLGEHLQRDTYTQTWSLPQTSRANPVKWHNTHNKRGSIQFEQRCHA